MGGPRRVERREEVRRREEVVVERRVEARRAVPEPVLAPRLERERVTATTTGALRLPTLSAKRVQTRPTLQAESIAGKPRALPDLAALRKTMATYYGPDVLEHPNFHYYEAGLDLAKVKHERFDDNGRLREVALVAPYALGGEWKASPISAVRSDGVDVHTALADHARLTKFYLDHGVTVHFVVHPEAASQAVFGTDVLTSIGRLPVVSNPLHWERGLETLAYSNAIRMADYDAKAPIEWGDLQLATVGNTMLVFQGVGSMRSTDASVASLGRMLADHKAEIGSAYEHVPIRLKQVSTEMAVGTLHLDYAMGIVGTGSNRALIVVPDALENPKETIAMLQRRLGIPDGRVIIANKEQMAYGATNLEQVDATGILYSDHPVLAPVAEKMRQLGFDVFQLPMKSLAVVDGNAHCVTAQLVRDRP